MWVWVWVWVCYNLRTSAEIRQGMGVIEDKGLEVRLIYIFFCVLCRRSFVSVIKQRRPPPRDREGFV